MDTKTTPQELHHHDIAALLFLVTISACILPQRGQVVDATMQRSIASHHNSSEDDDNDNDKENSHFEVAEFSSRDEGRFCRAIRSISRDIRATLGRHFRCVSSDYVEAGYFGTTRDLATHSFSNGCFSGSRQYEEELIFQEHPISQPGSIRTTMRLGADVRIDLSSYGVVPSKFVFEGTKNATEALVEISFVDAAIRAPLDLGYTLARLENDRNTPARVRKATSSCRDHLCQEYSIYTSEIVSANVRVTIVLTGGSATALRPASINAPVSVTGSGTKFVIRPAQRVNLAARFSPSRDALAAADACSPDPIDVRKNSPGVTPPCTTIIHRGIHARLEECVKSNQLVTCRISLTSPGRDSELFLSVDERRNSGTSSFVDERGSSINASYGEVSGGASMGSDRAISVPMVANTSTMVSLEFSGVASSARTAQRVSLVARHAQSNMELRFDFRGVEIYNEPTTEATTEATTECAGRYS